MPHQIRLYGETKIRIDLDHIGEGYMEDYDPDDPTDEPLLRFSGYIWDETTSEWRDPGKASYCTELSANLPTEAQVKALDYLLDRLGPLLATDEHRRIADILSTTTWQDVVDNKPIDPTP